MSAHGFVPPQTFDSDSKEKSDSLTSANVDELPGRKTSRGPKGPAGTVIVEGVIVRDEVFGDLNDGGPNYRGLGWIRAAVLSIKTQIGLGVLGIPSILSTLGLVPGILIILFFGALSTYCNHTMGAFKLKHPQVYSLADCGYIIGGPFGREFLGVFFWLQMTAVAGATMLGIATAFNTMTDNAGCSAVWALVGAILGFAVSAIRTMDRISWFGWVGLAGIMGSVITLSIAVGVQERPSAAPQVGPWDPQTILFNSNVSFLDAMTAVSTIIFSFAGAPNVLLVMAEMRRPEDFNKTLAVCQSFVTATYLIIGCVVYHYAGIYVASPALGSAGVLLSKVCYGIALPGLVVGIVLNSHSPAKYIFLRIMKGINSPHLNANNWQHWVIWLSCVTFNVTIAYIIAEAIPFFGDLVGLIGALIATICSLCAQGAMWLHEHQAEFKTNRSSKFMALATLNVFIVLGGLFCCVAGTVGSVIAINKSLHNGSTTAPFSC